MLTIPTAMRQLLNAGGPFIGQNRSSTRLTVQPNWALHTSTGSMLYTEKKKLPVRWWQDEANSQVEIEIPNVQQVQIVRDLTQQAGTLTAVLYNNKLQPNGQVQQVGALKTLGEPGFLSWNYGSTAQARERWGQDPNIWANLLTENALIRVYQGYGGQTLSIPDAVAAGNITLTGVFLLDDPAIEAQTGYVTLNGRDMAKLLIDQYTVPPLVPAGVYPLNYWGPGQSLSTAKDKNQAVGNYGWAQVRAVYANSSAAYTLGASTAQANGLKALDSNNRTAWQSEVVGAPGDQVWIEFGVQEGTNGIYIDPMWGNYMCYVSIQEGGEWLGTGNVGGIPYSYSFGVPFETPKWYEFDRIYQANFIRLTFTGLHSIPGGYVAAMRGFEVGQRLQISPTQGTQITGFAVTGPWGYHMVDNHGHVTHYGNADILGGLGGKAISSAVAGIAAPPPQGRSHGGYWLVQQNGHVHNYGPVTNYGQQTVSNGSPVNDFRARLDGTGYWQLQGDGVVTGFGSSTNLGGMTGPVGGAIGLAITSTQNGYWIMDETGNVAAFGDATDYGQPAGLDNNRFVSIESNLEGTGYWCVTDAGKVYAYGNAANHGDASGAVLSAPIVKIRRSGTPSSLGYYLVGEDGKVYTYGDAPYYGGLQGQQAAAPDYTDYSDIITDLAMWAGFWLKPASGPNTRQVYGIIETTGAYDTLGPLGIDFFDKQPVIDVMTNIANLVGYLVRCDELGGFRFEAPNIWADGNFDENDNRTSFIPVIDERLTLSDFTMTQTDQTLRSPVVVAVADPYEYGGPVKGTNVTTFVPPYTPALKGIVKSCLYTVPLQVDAKDQQYFAELIAVRLWQQSRTGVVVAWCDPSICVNDQVRIYERTTGETNIHYVQAVQTTWTASDGKFEMQLTTYWLGDRSNWAITSNLSSFFGPGTARPTTTEPGGATQTINQLTGYTGTTNGAAVPAGVSASAFPSFSLTDHAVGRLARSGSPKTSAFTGAGNPVSVSGGNVA